MMDTFLKLTFREQEVLKFLSSGLQDKEIAFKMSIAQKTVQNHLDKIYKKIEVSNRTEAALFASDIGLNKYKIPKSKH